MSQCLLSERILNANTQIPQHIQDFLRRINICKVEVSQVQNTWEIYFSCNKLPEHLLLRECSKYLNSLFPQVEKLILRPMLTTEGDLKEIFQENQSRIYEYLTYYFPSAKGWLVNSEWELNKNHLQINMNSPLGVKYLLKKGCHRFLEKFLEEVFGEKLAVSFKYNPSLKQAEIKPLSTVVPIEPPKPLANAKGAERKEKESKVLWGKVIKGQARPISEIVEEEPNVIILGKMLAFEVKELKTGRAILSFDLTDFEDSITCKLIRDLKEIEKLIENLPKESFLKVRGAVQLDKFSQELTLLVSDINQEEAKGREDTALEKRVELHLHTKMSSMDGVTSANDLVKLAAQWGHEAIAITDHGVVQAFPEAYEAGEKYGVKIIYGMEAYIFDDSLKTNTRVPTYHCLLLVKNLEGLKNLYKLVTESHLNYFSRVPRIPKSLLARMRQGLLVGTACEAGELIRTYLNNRDKKVLQEIAAFYDFIEIQPRGNNQFLLRNGILSSEEELIQLNKDLYQLGKELDKPVVATGDVHFANPEDEVFRRILMAGKGFDDADHQAPLYFKTTEEMLKEFSYLGSQGAKEVVVDNPLEICRQIEKIKPIPDEFYPPVIPGAEEEIINLTYETAHKLYGPELPSLVEKRIKKELDSIINNGFAVLYLIAHKVVKKSNEDGYLVGSRGSVGSSLVATLTGITEVNPLKPHYRCPHCYYTEFITDGSFGSGADLPDKNCPQCKQPLIKDGHDIPFEVFLGFKGDKVPDIDLNFSGDYQPRAHKFIEELFGRDNVFRAGTISTIASRTAYGFVKNYFDDRKQYKRSAEINRLVEGCSGVKKTTGQHPGGLMVVPKGIDVHDFTPLQRPADDVNSEIITTHFDYHSISSRLVKLDILGHDDPTVIKMLEDLTGVNAKSIPLDDPQTMSLFSSTKALNVDPEELGSRVGTFGIPEFGTKFVRQMLEDTKPKTFSELVRISGFSHGTDVWLNNAQDLIKNGIAKLSEAISARDDIMIFLMNKGVEPSIAFKIMENVRKGKGVSPEHEAIMLEHNVPTWYIESCKKIKYMFPKAHAVAYVMMAFRIAYFKVNYPLAFYATSFTVRADEFDAQLICAGPAKVKDMIKTLQEKGNNLTAKESRLLTILELAWEMYLRGFTFQKVNLKKSQAQKFIIEGNSLIPPFASLQGVGSAAAWNIENARKEYFFTSVDDLRKRGKLTKTVIEALDEHGCLAELPESDQLSLFN